MAIDDLIRQRIKKDLAAKNGTKPEIADRYGVSVGTVKRIAKELKPVTDVADNMAGAIAQGAIRVGEIKSLNYGQYLEDMIEDLARVLPAAEAKSREGVAGRLMEALKAHREFMSMEQAVDWLLALPDFDPVEFTNLLKRKYGHKRRAR